eukprot:scaffold4457_cov94-Isochrysis_galbana.AAC.5
MGRVGGEETGRVGAGEAVGPRRAAPTDGQDWRPSASSLKENSTHTQWGSSRKENRKQWGARLQQRRSDGCEEGLPHKRPPVVKARLQRLHARLRAGEHRGRKVVAVGVVQKVVCVLVVREQVLRDPDEDVEADGMRGELEPIVDARLMRGREDGYIAHVRGREGVELEMVVWAGLNGDEPRGEGKVCGGKGNGAKERHRQIPSR